MCMWVYVCGCVYTCAVAWLTHLFLPQPRHQAGDPNKASLCADMDTVLFLAQFPSTLPLLKPKHTCLLWAKKTVSEVLGEERKAFPESHLVLMQGPLVWITGTYYRRTQADPSSLSQGKWEPSTVMGGWGSKRLGSSGVNRGLRAGCHPTWLVPLFNEEISLRYFQNPPLKNTLPLNLSMKTMSLHQIFPVFPPELHQVMK